MYCYQIFFQLALGLIACRCAAAPTSSDPALFHAIKPRAGSKNGNEDFDNLTSGLRNMGNRPYTVDMEGEIHLGEQNFYMYPTDSSGTPEGTPAGTFLLSSHLGDCTAILGTEAVAAWHKKYASRQSNSPRHTPCELVSGNFLFALEIQITSYLHRSRIWWVSQVEAGLVAEMGSAVFLLEWRDVTKMLWFFHEVNYRVVRTTAVAEVLDLIRFVAVATEARRKNPHDSGAPAEIKWMQNTLAMIQERTDVCKNYFVPANELFSENSGRRI
ncbi:MAG: hypothetical protein M1829_006263 [Trizodia sp. TS-e1964]|nr:MAG: hypothetical protein M1829_006263 [Trizodia sp. TS-e1964]